MKLIAGLGNPGPRYADSRHNVGFLVVDELARRWRIEVTRYDRHFEGLVGEGPIAGQRCLLLKPATFMNLSGRSVAAVWRFYKLELADLLVVHDDLDLPVGKLRLRSEGSSGGHKGLGDVILQIGSEGFARLRVGIGKVHRAATVEYVLGAFGPQERELMETAVATAADAVESWLRNGIESAMNQFNRRREEKDKPRPPQPPAGGAAEGEPS